MTVSSLFDLRGQLAAYLAPHLPGCEILYSMPTVRRPLIPGVTTLVMSDHSVKRSETALHRESMEAAELLSEQLLALTARGDFPCGVAGLTWAETGFLRGCGAFGRRGLLTVYCTLAETPKEEDEA